jgi:pyridoxamine---pyruvate transaminase
MIKYDKYPLYSLTSGPCDTHPEILEALSRQVLYFEDPYFVNIYKNIGLKLKTILGTKNDVILMPGEAILGLEAAARNMIMPGDRCLNLVSGVYGKGFEWYIKQAGGIPVELAVGYDDAIDPAQVEIILKKEKDLRFLSVVHSETPSGTLNPVDKICRMAKEHGLITIVDSVSAAGGTEMKVDEWGIDICVVGPQKCLGSTPGACILSVSEEAWDLIRKNESPRYSYLSIYDWKELWLDKGVFPCTPFVSDIVAFDKALDLIFEEGLENVWARHDYTAKVCREGIKGMGLELWPKSEKISNNCCTAIKMPQGIEDKKLRNHLREKYGMMISGGHGSLSGQLFRISHMGYTAKPQYVILALALVEKTLDDLGFPVKLGSGVAAALKAM